MDFIAFKKAVAAQFKRMSQHELYVVDVEKDKLWETYLGSFPAGSNPIYRERTEHDCSCCRQFVKAVGGVVAIIDGRLETIWDINSIGGEYQVVTNAMSLLVSSGKIDNLFRTTEKTAGTDKNFEQLVDSVKTWEHFFVNIPNRFVLHKDAIGPKLSDTRATHDVFLRGLNEITTDAVDTVLELIKQNSLYRGEEHLHSLTEFSKMRDKVHANALDKDIYVWDVITKVSPAVSRIRNTSIGTLLQDLSEGVDMEDAVKKFEAMVAPANYKRPTALVTEAMVDKARAKIEELGLTSALKRRYAELTDITVNNVLYADRSARSKMQGDVFDEIASSVRGGEKAISKVEEVTIDKFLTDVLPNAQKVEVMLNNSHQVNLVSLIAPEDPTANHLFKWNNNFSWSYDGDMADSMKERVKAAGGSVEGVLCCRLAWEYTDDLDFHMREPTGHTIYFGTRLETSPCGGRLDVDANGGSGMMDHPVENIFYRDTSRLAEGIYELSVNNFRRRSDGVGFEVEIEFGGQTHSISYPKVLRSGETVKVAKLKYTRAKGFEVVESLPTSTTPKMFWGVRSNTFMPVSSIMLSPNYWDEQGVGNKHYFFMLEGCKNEGRARGFYNEFLKSELNEHRKVFEIVGSKMKTEECDNQLSGVGFSSTQRNELVCRVSGSFTRVLKIVF